LCTLIGALTASMHTKLWARTDYSSLTDVRASPMYGHFRPTRRIQVIQEQAYAVADRVPKEVYSRWGGVACVIYLLRSRMKNKDAPPSFDSRDEKPNLLNFYLAGMRKYMIIPSC
jgi:hypothetical protein